MRKTLSKLNEFRGKFTGTFVRCGTKPGWKGNIDTTILLKDIKDMNGNIVSSHLWFNCTKGFMALGELNEGEMIEFFARVKPYVKGYVNNREFTDEREIDYKLSHPTKVRRV